MTSQALYNRWRGQTFDDILGQDHITATLRNQIRAGRIGHAYLFTGVRGTGKTSTARILAKAVSCIGDTDQPPCNACHICQTITAGRSLDLIEIDAASNRGIDEIRDLRDRVGFVPQEARFKVYVIDEVHMLTKEAFNALLKTLEEPPEHVIFILCTTEPHRLPDTILSRCQRFDFRRASVEAIVRKLTQICEGEGIHITPEALDFVARRGAGSFRDAESLLDQVAAYASDTVDLPFVQQILGAVSIDLVSDLIGAMIRGDAAQGLYLINTAMDQGADPRQFLGEILDQLRGMLLLGVGSEEGITVLSPDTVQRLRNLMSEEGFSAQLLIKAIRAFNDAAQDLRNAVRLQLPLELALVETVVERQELPGLTRAGDAPAQDEPPRVGDSTRTESVSDGNAEDKSSAGNDVPPHTQDETPIARKAATATIKDPPVASSPETPKAEAPSATTQNAPDEVEPTQQLSLEWVRGKWPQVITKMGTVSPQLQATLRSVYPLRVRDNVIVLGCESVFHRDTLKDEKRRVQVEQVMRDVFGAFCRIDCIVENVSEIMAQDRGGGSGDEHLFSRSDRRDQREQELRNHPVVKALEQRGGQVTRIELDEEE